MTRTALLASLAKRLTRRKLTLSVCESCTGGMLSSMLTDIPGSSKYFVGGIVAYSNRTKEKIVGVKRSTLKKYGAVSAQVAREMASGVCRITKSNIGIGITGIAGPSGGSKKKPVGLVYIAVVYRQQVLVEQFHIKGSRAAVRKRACQQALKLLHRLIGDHNSQ